MEKDTNKPRRSLFEELNSMSYDKDNKINSLFRLVTKLIKRYLETIILNFQNFTTRIARAQGSRIRRQNRKIITGKRER